MVHRRRNLVFLLFFFVFKLRWHPITKFNSPSHEDSFVLFWKRLITGRVIFRFPQFRNRWWKKKIRNNSKIGAFFSNKNDLRHAGTKISIAVIVWSSFECSTTLHSSVLLPKKSTEDDFPNLFHQFLPQVNIYNHFFLDCSHEPVLNCWVQYLGLKIVKQKKQTNIGRQRRELAPLQRGWTVVNVPVGRCHGCRHLLIFSSDYYYILSHYRWKLGPLRFLPSFFFFRFPYRVLCGLFFFRGPVTAGRSSAE